MKHFIPPGAAPRHASIAEAALYADVSTTTIRRRISDGTLVAVRFGPRLIRVDLDSLDAALRTIPSARFN